MTTIQEKASLVKFVLEDKSIVNAQRRFKLEFNKTAPGRNNIRRWVNQFKETGSLLKRKGTGRPNKTLARLDAVADLFYTDPNTSIRKAAAKMNIPPTSVHRILHKINMSVDSLDLHENKKMKIENIPDGILFGLGNPLLDISANTDQSFLDKYSLEANNAILAGDEHQPMYKEMEEKLDVEYLAGGATQNSMRVAQWILHKKNSVSFMGCVGKDEFSKTLEKQATAAGVNVKYQYHDTESTGTCAVVVTQNGTCRSLVANLAAANHFTKCHIDVPENRMLLEKAQYYYISGFFLTVSPETIVEVGKHACETNKTFCMNLSAPFLCEFFQEPMMKAFPYIDILFSNETEAAKFAEIQKLGVTDIKEIALKVSSLPKVNKQKSRIVIFTQGADSVVMAKDGEIKEFPAVALPSERLIDTNGAGDAFVGGFLSQLVQGKSEESCIKCGIWAATEIIQRSGCTYSNDVKYIEE